MSEQKTDFDRMADDARRLANLLADTDGREMWAGQRAIAEILERLMVEWFGDKTVERMKLVTTLAEHGPTVVTISHPWRRTNG